MPGLAWYKVSYGMLYHSVPWYKVHMLHQEQLMGSFCWLLLASKWHGLLPLIQSSILICRDVFRADCVQGIR